MQWNSEMIKTSSSVSGEGMNTKINIIIGNYFDSERQTDYAIMINGKWGCGKTYYIEHDLKDLVERRSLKYIYVSLNGCENFTKISNKITYRLLFKKTNLKIDDDFLDGLLELGEGLSELHSFTNIIYKSINKIKGIIIKPIEEKMISEIDPNKIVLIFDDVERISDNALCSDILGMIYEKYVKKGYKTIFVSDEINITDPKYNTIKEKIIRRTVSYDPDRKVQLGNFINNQFFNTKHKAYLDKNKEKFIGYFIELQITNLRTISFIIDNFIHVLENISEDMKNKFGDFLFKNILILTNEYKLGNITIDNLQDKKELMHLADVYMKDEISRRYGKERERTYLDDFHDKYISVQIFSDFTLIAELFDFILTGYLDASKLDKEIRSIFHSEFMEESERTFNILTRDWIYLEEEEMKNEIEKILCFLDEGKYYIARLPYIYTYLKFIQERKYLPNWQYNIEKTILSALTKSSQDPDMVPDRIDLIEYHNKFDEDRPNDTFYNDLIEKIKFLSKQKTMACDKDRIDSIFHEIIAGDMVYPSSLYNNYNLFQDIVKTETERYLFELTNRSIGILQLYIRHNIMRISNAGETFYDEKIALEKIVGYMESNIGICSQKFNHLRIVRLQELVEDMKKAINHLESTRRR
jgi:hypothetical protein